jgi:hypothetical protein
MTLVKYASGTYTLWTSCFNSLSLRLKAALTLSSRPGDRRRVWEVQVSWPLSSMHQELIPFVESVVRTSCFNSLSLRLKAALTLSSWPGDRRRVWVVQVSWPLSGMHQELIPFVESVVRTSCYNSLSLRPKAATVWYKSSPIQFQVWSTWCIINIFIVFTVN